MRRELAISSDFAARIAEQVKTGQVNPDRPLVGPSVNTFVGAFVKSSRRAFSTKTGKPSLVGLSWALSWAGSWGHSWTHSWGHSWGHSWANLFFACSVCRPFAARISALQTYPNLQPPLRVGPPLGYLPRGGANLCRFVPVRSLQTRASGREFVHVCFRLLATSRHSP